MVRERIATPPIEQLGVMKQRTFLALGESAEEDSYIKRGMAVTAAVGSQVGVTFGLTRVTAGSTEMGERG